MRAGRIYVLRNENMKELIVKVGKTLRSADARAAELAKATGVLGRYHVLFQEPVVDIDYAENLVHQRLKAYRLAPNREFFQVPYELAIRTVFETCREVNGNLPPAPVVYVRLSLHGHADARRLQELLAPHRGGDVQVVVVYENGDALCEVKIGDAWRVRLSETLTSELHSWLGAENVLFVRWPADGPPLPPDPSFEF